MLESPWGRRAGPVLATLALTLAVASTALGAPDVPDRPPPGCARGASGEAAAPTDAPARGAWYAIEPVIDRGTLVGQRLTLGAVDGGVWTVGLPAEAWATGPVGGQVLFGSDDGRRSTIRLFDGIAGCQKVVGTVRDIVRSAVLDPLGGSLHEHRLDRTDRADLGVWQRPLGSDGASRVLPGIEADARFGRTWRTELAWSSDGRHLVVASCGAVACRYRLADRAGGIVSVADPDLGALVTMVDRRLVVRAACRGLPCPLLSVDPDGGPTIVLDPAAGPVGVVAGDAGEVVLGTLGERGPGLRRMQVATGRSIELPGGDVPIVPHAGFGADLPPGWFLVAGGDGPGPLPGIRARATDDHARPITEVRP